MDHKSADYSEAFKKFSEWIDANQAKLNSSCHCKANNVNQNHVNHLSSTPNSSATAVTSSIQPPSLPIATIDENTSNHDHQHLNNSTNVHNICQSVTSATDNYDSNPDGIDANGSSYVTSTSTNNSLTNNGHIVGLKTPINRRIMWKNVISQHEKLQEEIEEVGKQLNFELKRHLNTDKSLGEHEVDKCAKLEEKWHKLWLESLEQLVIVERTKRCPKHNSTLIGKPSTKNLSPTNKSISRRPRPLSYPSNQTDRLEWDYKHTLSLTGCHKENGSHVDLDSVDEQVTKNLTEFGENYEVWLAKDDEIGSIPMHSRPPSVEPAEKPELAKATVITSTNSTSPDEINCNMLMLTSPSSMLTVDATKKCSHNSKPRQGYGLLIWCLGELLFVVFAALVFSSLFQEPHFMHKSYYHTQPPV